MVEEAAHSYHQLGIKQTVAKLKKGVDVKRAGNTFNTLVAKKDEKVNSFSVFENIRKTSKSSAYFHIPFCKTHCAYCAYEKIVTASRQKKLRYLDLLKKEIVIKKGILGGNLNPDIFYVGGGTPTVLTLDEIKIFLDLLSGIFDTKNNLEFTFETTPQAIIESDGMEKFALLKEKGVNRINIGVESFSENVAKKNGRIQRADDVYKCVESLRSVGFEKINLDLIYGLRGHTSKIWQDDLNHATQISPDSVTTFYLRIRNTAPFYLHYLKHPHDYPSLEEKQIMRIMAVHHFEQNGYSENNSDYFIKSKEKIYMYHPAQPHNIFRNLIGFGVSAYSIAGNTQIFNIKDTSDYMQVSSNSADPIDRMIVLNKHEHMKKRFADSLRTEFNDNVFKEEFSCSAFDELRETINTLYDMGLVSIEAGKVRTTKKGRLITDEIANYINYSLLLNSRTS